MTQEQTNRMVQLLEAQASGKQIQARFTVGGRYENVEITSKLCCRSIDTPRASYDEDIENIRIKPETKYVPYELEDLARFMVKGTLFRYTDDGDDYSIITVRKNGIIDMERTEGYGDRFRTLFREELCKKFILNGHPAGNLMEVD